MADTLSKSSLLPISFLALLLVLLVNFGPSISLGSSLSFTITSLVNNPTIKFIFASSKPVQLVAVVHTCRNQVVKEKMPFYVKMCLFSFGMQGVNIRAVGEVCDVRFNICFGEGGEGWELEMGRKGAFGEARIMVLALVWELRSPKGMPVSGSWVDGPFERKITDEEVAERARRRLTPGLLLCRLCAR